MNIVSDMQRFTHPAMPDVTIYAWEDIRSNKPQEILVSVSPYGRVPAHKHSVDAKMIIVAGKADLLFDEVELASKGQVLNKKTVVQGDIVSFESGMTHGFQAHQEGLSFVSINGGIVDSNPFAWDVSDLKS